MTLSTASFHELVDKQDMSLVVLRIADVVAVFEIDAGSQGTYMENSES